MEVGVDVISARSCMPLDALHHLSLSEYIHITAEVHGPTAEAYANKS